MANPFPYRSEYSLSDRAHCQYCHNFIAKDSLRLSARVRSQFHDGYDSKWYHYDCFFEKYTPSNTSQFQNIGNLRFEDQKKIEESINSKIHVIKNSAGKKRSSKVLEKNANFKVEFAKSGRSKCNFCERLIPKDIVRIGKLDTDSEDAKTFGPFHRWFCEGCFISCRNDLEFFDDASALMGFEDLCPKTQRELKSKLKKSWKKLAVKEEKEEAEIQVDENSNNVQEDLSKELKEQSDKLYYFKAQCKKMRKVDLQALMKANNIEREFESNDARFDYMADALTFGIPAPCPTCKGPLMFKNFRYECEGNISEWERCSYYTSFPSRSDIVVPDDLLCYECLVDLKPIETGRLVDPSIKESFAKKEMHDMQKMMEGVIKKEKVQEFGMQLRGYIVSSVGRLDLTPVLEYGGEISKSLYGRVALAVCTEATFSKQKLQGLKTAEQYSIPLVSTSIFDRFKENMSLMESIKASLLSSWGMGDQEMKDRLDRLCTHLKVAQVFKSGLTKPKNESITTLVMKSGAIVDPHSYLAHKTHVLREKGNIYSAKLNRTVLEDDINSYYKLQILEDDVRPYSYHFYRSWGRVGADTHGRTTDRMSKEEAIKQFKEIFFEKTKNHWEDRKNFRKKPDAYYYTPEVDDTVELEELDNSTTTSTLDPAILNLLAKIFDIRQMELTMQEFKIDLEKLPLGKLSKNQLLEACSTLKSIQEMLEDPAKFIPNRLKSLCDKYYTLVPHSFRNGSVELINTKEVVEHEMSILDCLLEMEISFSIIADKKAKEGKEDPFDHHYKKLKTDLKPLPSDCEMYQTIQKYLTNTHASTHNQYKVTLNGIFEIHRHGEEERFKPFEKNSNRKLLWHGSRMTNYAGILSQGLRIAPKEAPSSGYMFGKGVYFADSFSKSANYCMSSDDAYLVLSEVALGNEQKMYHAHNVQNLDKKFLSVKAIGQSQPDPMADIKLENGCVVPLGKMKKNPNVKDSSLLYNEYIVYNEAQIKQRYLVDVSFKYTF